MVTLKHYASEKKTANRQIKLLTVHVT